MPLSCSNCLKQINLAEDGPPVQFCPFCGNSIDPSQVVSKRYCLEKEIGKGGMGEVYLALDRKCGRFVALKKVRSDLANHPQIVRRFLNEAAISCQLSHPGIIPIYNLEKTKTASYYTMPYVEGETLKEVIRRTRKQEKNGEPLDHLGGSIPALIRIFTAICQAVAYAHSKNILHRDLKLENIMLGKYGEVLIFDWGLATFAKSEEPEEEIEEISFNSAEPLTRIGKTVGTVAYMAPERALGDKATFQTDIYSLGVILYYLLTLRPPFQRKDIKEFRKQIPYEEWVEPIQIAPYRDIPQALSRIAKKCIESEPSLRFQSVEEMIGELENYTEGRSEWAVVANLDTSKKEDWEFQELVWMGDHLAINRSPEEFEWVNLMISRQSFQGNLRIECEIELKNNSKGIGILFNLSEPLQRSDFHDGYCLRLGSDLYKNTQLTRSNVVVIEAPDVFLNRNTKTKICIEKVEHLIRIYLDDTLYLSYIAQVPMMGTHIGFLAPDGEYEMSAIKVSLGNLNLMVDCLAVPDAFLAKKDYNQALSEYRRIAYSFPDRQEGREALFRAGLTLIEKAKVSPSKQELLEEAFQEFQKLHDSPAAPLEYLGKAFIYKTLGEEEEEVKCFEMAYRRFPNHPLLRKLQEHILTRMHEVARTDRMITYRFILLAICYFPQGAFDKHSRKLISSLKKHWEPLYFIEETFQEPTDEMKTLMVPLAFWLAEPYRLAEMISEGLSSHSFQQIDFANALRCLIELGHPDLAQEKLIEIKEAFPDFSFYPTIHKMICCKQGLLDQTSLSFDTFHFDERCFLLFFMDEALDKNRPDLVHKAFEESKKHDLSFDLKVKFAVRDVWAYLIEKNWEMAKEKLHHYPIDLLIRGSSELHFLYGCWLEATEGSEIALIHFKGLLPTLYPRSWNLASHQIAGELGEGWQNKAFWWEKKQLSRQLKLYQKMT